MKKLIIFMAAAIILTASAYSQATSETDSSTIRIGISKLLAHPALDAIENGIKDYLEDNGVNASFDTQNANGEISTAASIAQVFADEGCDIVVGIATPTAQALANTFEDIPVVFASVTDVPAAGLDGIGNVCGVSDAVPIQEHFSIIERLTGAKRIGMVYTSGEANGIALMESMKTVCEENGVELISASVANSAEVKMAAESIIDRVNAMYVATDNTVVSALSALSDTCSDAAIPLFSADTTSAFGTDVLLAGGFDYYASGLLTGELIKALIDGESPSDIGTVYLTDLELYVNLDVAEKLGIEIPQDMIDGAAYVIRDGITETA